MKIIAMDASILLSGGFPYEIDPSVAESAKSLVQSHIEWFGEYYRSKNLPDPNKHSCLVAVNEEHNRIVAYRYFHFEPGSEFCELFAVCVAPNWRRQGIAKLLFQESIKVLGEAGCTHCTIRFAEPNEERVGLFAFYKQYAGTKKSSMRFRIYYGAEQFDY